MKYFMYSVFDSAAAIYNPPNLFRSNDEAMRWFTDVCNDPKSTPYKHAKDFSLVSIGAFDDVSGAGIFEMPVKLAEASAVRRQQFNDVEMDIPTFVKK